MPIKSDVINYKLLPNAEFYKYYLPSRGSVREVAGITSITRVKYRVWDTRMAIAKAVFSPD